MNPPPSTIRVADDNASWRAAIARMLRASGFVTRTFPSAAEFLAQPEPEQPGCVLIDMRMPGLSGLELQDAMAKMGCHLPVIFLTGHAEIADSVRAMRHGAEDFLPKSAPKEEVLDAIQRALIRDSKERAERQRLQQLRALVNTLTERENEVWQHVVRGELNKQIADALGINERTVKLHRTNLSAKLGVHSVAELTQLWTKTRLS